MKQTYINQLKDHIGESVTLKGWLYNKRSSGKLVFLQLRDGTGIVQGVVFKPNDEALYDLADSIGQESSIIVTGTVKEDTRSSLGVEVDVTGLEVLQNVHDYPITPKGTRHRVPDGQPASVDPLEKAARGAEDQAYGDQGGP